jgi:hypothetical protein
MAALALGLGFAPSPANAYTMTFDEFGHCSSNVGTCSSFLGPDPSGLVTNQNVLIFTLIAPGSRHQRLPKNGDL